MRVKHIVLRLTRDGRDGFMLKVLRRSDSLLARSLSVCRDLRQLNQAFDLTVHMQPAQARRLLVPGRKGDLDCRPAGSEPSVPIKLDLPRDMRREGRVQIALLNIFALIPPGDQEGKARRRHSKGNA